MPNDLTRRALGRAALGALAAPAILKTARADDVLKIRCSLDTAPSHPRNQGVVDYLKKVEAASGGKITGEVFHSGQLFADINVSKALLQGQVEMAVPGLWVLTGIVPDTDFVQLPLFYGQPAEVTHRATDGKPGQYVAAQLEKKLRVHIPGPWMDLGYQNWYSTKTPLTGPDSFKGLKIRSPGGAAISWRIKFFGGLPNVTPWPNVPLALSQGTFDALVSTDESVNSAKLWDAGVRYSYADHQFMGQYVPMFTDAFWGKLSPDQQKMLTDIWAQNIGGYRAAAFASQANARKALEANNIKVTDPSAAELAESRKKMLAQQDGMIKDTNISPDLVKLVQESIGSSA
ncbi:MAG TPA: TRAP transporter substrate-binding protein DctP [Acetobacteraceae bacterium]|nr:TRAP transporter substrate-binding protein DctP [Acetobacteraceae bacterium]